MHALTVCTFLSVGQRSMCSHRPGVKTAMKEVIGPFVLGTVDPAAVGAPKYTVKLKLGPGEACGYSATDRILLQIAPGANERLTVVVN